jgi:predicted RNA-binding Zn ribbon-like protein
MTQPTPELDDTSRPGRRQWCSMARCGNIAKTRAYRAGSAVRRRQ